MPPGLQRGCLHRRRRLPAAAIMSLALGCVAVVGCGYRVVGRANTLPPDAKTLAILPFGNRTTTYRIEQVLTESVVHEFIARTKYKVISDENGADLVLRGDVLNLGAGAVLFDPTTGVATTVVVTVIARVTLQDRNGKMLYQANNLVFREPYEIAEICPTPTQVCPATEANPNSFFQE